MKVKLLCNMLIEGKEVQAGEIIDIKESSKDKYIAKGWGELVKKEVKVKKETKESASNSCLQYSVKILV